MWVVSVMKSCDIYFLFKGQQHPNWFYIATIWGPFKPFSLTKEKRILATRLALFLENGRKRVSPSQLHIDNHTISPKTTSRCAYVGLLVLSPATRKCEKLSTIKIGTGSEGDTVCQKGSRVNRSRKEDRKGRKGSVAEQEGLGSGKVGVNCRSGDLSLSCWTGPQFLVSIQFQFRPNRSRTQLDDNS
ncbi:hypothetical protein J6590_014260 [Homalodisca vitripennis]|nr:hypothetical protein J6590_014260 [Homalodisca vitripennis]